MAQGQLPQLAPLLTMTMIASEAITLYAAVIGTSGTEGYCSLSTDNSMALGVVLNAADAGGEVVVCMEGVVYACVESAVAIYSIVHPSDSSGNVDDDIGAAQYALGIALTAGTAAGDHIAVLLTPGSLYAAS